MTEAEDDWGFVHRDGILPGVVASAVGYAATDVGQTIHRGLPSPYLTFIITLDEPVIGGFTVEQATGPDALRTEVVTSGLHTHPAYIAQTRTQSGIQLAIYPPACRMIFGMPAAELTAGIYEGRDVLGSGVAMLREQLAQMRGWPDRFRQLQTFLRHRTDAGQRQEPPRAEVVEAWKWLAWHRGTGSIAGVADHVHLSRRQLNMLFTREFGIGPKALNRLIRFQHAVRMISDGISDGSRPNLAAIAQTCGYGDQSHLVRDFRQYTGTSPTGWLAEEHGNILAGGHRNGD